MWYLKFRVRHHGCIFTPKTKEYGVTDFTYPLGHVVVGDKIHLSGMHVLHGPGEGVKKYLNYLKSHPDVLKAEGSDNFLFTLVQEQFNPEAYKAVYNPALLYVAPVINDALGWETWELACWDRKPLANLLAFADSPIVIESKLLEFKEKHLHDVYVASLLPKLPQRQMDALRLAFEEGYYTFPKRTNLDKLARLMTVSKATFQEHLKRAETKIIPFLLERSLHSPEKA